MKKLLFLVIASIAVALVGCGKSDSALPEGQSLANPTGNDPVKGAPATAPQQQEGVPQPGQQLPGAPAGVTRPGG